jgi:hypothetical protein
MFDEDRIPEYLNEIYAILFCAFPEGVREEEYRAILSLLHEFMSHRNIAMVLAKIANRDRFVVYNDVMGFGLDPAPPKEDVEQVKMKLDNCGYQPYLEKNSFRII